MREGDKKSINSFGT